MYTIWKNGILFAHNNGTMTLIEVADQTTRIYLVMRCIEGCELHLARQRSIYVSLIKSLLSKVCPSIKVEEFLLLPQSSYPPVICMQISIAAVARSVVNAHVAVSYKTDDSAAPQHVHLDDLLHFDALLAIKDHCLRAVFSHRHSVEIVPFETVRRMCSAADALAGIFRDELRQNLRELT